jgi:hypothetical protein
VVLTSHLRTRTYGCWVAVRGGIERGGGKHRHDGRAHKRPGVVRTFFSIGGGAADVAGDDGRDACAYTADGVVEAAKRLRVDLAAADLLVELKWVY